MKFKLESTCLKCGSRDIEAELGMGQGSGLLNMRCRGCGETEGWSDQDMGRKSIDYVFDVGNGILSEPWTLERLKEIVGEQMSARNETNLDCEHVFISNYIWDEMCESHSSLLSTEVFCGMKVYLVDTEDSIIEVGG